MTRPSRDPRRRTGRIAAWLLVAAAASALPACPSRATDGAADALAACARTCPACAAGSICIGQDRPYAMRCARTCRDHRDCTEPDLCVVLGGLLPSPVCVDPYALTGCAGIEGCSPTAGTLKGECRDAHTAARLVTFPNHGGCGAALTHCENGCGPHHGGLGCL